MERVRSVFSWLFGRLRLLTLRSSRGRVFWVWLLVLVLLVTVDTQFPTTARDMGYSILAWCAGAVFFLATRAYRGPGRSTRGRSSSGMPPSFDEAFYRWQRRIRRPPRGNP